jgi:hypothetical protein
VQTATTTLAMIEQGLKVFTAIYKRVYRALKDEFKLLFALNAQYHVSDQEYFTFLDQQQVVAKSDYDLKSAKDDMEARLAPADRLLEAKKQDMEDAHRDKDRDQAKVDKASKEAETV